MDGTEAIGSSPIGASSDDALNLQAVQQLGGISNTTAGYVVPRLVASQTVGGIGQFTATGHTMAAAQTLDGIIQVAETINVAKFRGDAVLGGITQVTTMRRASLIHTTQIVGGVTQVAEALVHWNLPDCGWIKMNGDSFDALARHMPEGVGWLSWRWPGKMAMKFVSAVASYFDVAMASLCNLSRELDPRTTEAMLPEWEAALSLPDKCLPIATSIEERRRLVWFRLDKKRYRRVEDWKKLASMFGLTIDITPGWYVQRPALYDACYPVRYDLFPKLGRFRVYIDITNVQYPGYDYGNDANPGYPIPYGSYNANVDAFMCLIYRVKPANVVVLWNQFPTKLPCVLPPPDVPRLDFSQAVDSQYIPLI